jgi:SAM-dependent methyltransferase
MSQAAAGPSESGPSTTAAPAQEPEVSTSTPSASAPAPIPAAPATLTTATASAATTAPTDAPPAPAHIPGPLETGDSVLQVEVDTADQSDDGDSAFGGSSNASTSIASSVLNYEYENGRRYHGYRSGSYVLPNDDEEQDRLDLIHHIFLLILDGKLYNAPIVNPQRVLDVGTGTGIWCLDFGDENPGSEIVGTDLSPIQPSWVPPNVKFYIDDAESEWVYPPEEHFDLIHLREMSGSIADWDRLCTQAYNNLKPGGWLELQEPLAAFEADDETIERAGNINSWQEVLCDGAKKFGKDIREAPTLKGRMERAGFVDVHERLIKVHDTVR